MMLRTANVSSDGIITTNGFLTTRGGTDSTALSGKYSEDNGETESAKGMHPRLSSYFMDLDEFCSAANPKGKSSNMNVSQTSPGVPEVKHSISDKDPAGLFPTNTPSGQSRLFMPKNVKLDQAPSLNSPISPTNGISYASPMDGTRQRPGTPPALVSASHSAAPYNSQQQQRVVDSAASMVSLYQQHPGNASSSSQSSSSGAGSFVNDRRSSRDSISETQMDNNEMKKRAKRKPREYVYNPKPFKQKAPASSRLLAPKDDTYWDKRVKNNVAAKRSRENRRRKEIETVDKCTTLEHENAELRERISTLEKQNAWLEGKLTKFLLP